MHAQKVTEDWKRDNAKGNGSYTVVPLMSQSVAHLPSMLIEDRNTGPSSLLKLHWRPGREVSGRTLCYYT